MKNPNPINPFDIKPNNLYFILIDKILYEVKIGEKPINPYRMWVRLPDQRTARKIEYDELFLEIPDNWGGKTIRYVEDEEADMYDIELKNIRQLPKTQISLVDQLNILRLFANKLGLYDAAQTI